ncbi:hypothetical protein HXA31_19995 [Salipaludibacillus agaradhaerens]|uniref:hypothetical protein n=1 Tax=Salipaludibacillus TaxID=1884449 RepID=UPI0020D0C7EA|nr:MULTISPECIES: hypothetical protein [Salipaludibacillus]MCR6116613.1 hypothetical protein [Salipaludibacillus agaradhaerens]UTR13449.1 hypothetical protein MM221_12510 [Salipaludibacillus sp. LMS25]
MKKILFVSLLLISLFTLIGCNSQAAEYKSDIQSVADKMLDNASEAEIILDKYSSVWDYSIKSSAAIPVEEMVQVTGFDPSDIENHFVINAAGNIPDDFSTNIYSVNSYYEESGALGEIENEANEIKEKVNELNNPPKDFEKVYDELLDMFTYTEEYIEMALDPSGSLQSFNEEKNQLSSDIASKHKRIEAVMPN